MARTAVWGCAPSGWERFAFAGGVVTNRSITSSCAASLFRSPLALCSLSRLAFKSSTGRAVYCGPAAALLAPLEGLTRASASGGMVVVVDWSGVEVGVGGWVAVAVAIAVAVAVAVAVEVACVPSTATAVPQPRPAAGAVAAAAAAPAVQECRPVGISTAPPDRSFSNAC